MKFQTRELFRKYTPDDQFEKIVETASVSEMWKRCLTEYQDAIAVTDNGT